MVIPFVAVRYIFRSNWICDNRLFKQPAKYKTTAFRSTPIEPESEFLQVGLQMAR